VKLSIIIEIINYLCYIYYLQIQVLFVAFDKAWILGFVACKLLLYAQIVTLASTTFILTAMSFDRYLAICRPLNFGSSSEFSRPKIMIIVSWLMALLFASPQLLIFKQVPYGRYPDNQVTSIIILFIGELFSCLLAVMGSS